jgi:hypothetical protein
MKRARQVITIHEINQGSNEWNDLRAGLYTGSNAHKLLKFADAFKVVDGITSKYSLTEITGFGGNFHTKRGHALEEQAVELYEAITKTTVDRPGFVTNSKYPTCGYSPDGLAPVPLLEVKCFDEKEHKKLLAGNIKLSVLAQVHFGLLITERPYAHLIAYNPAKDPETGLPVFAVKDQFKIITIKANRNISNNFKRILQPAKVTLTKQGVPA